MTREPFAEYDDYDAVGLAELVDSGAVHPGELVEAAALRIERVNPAVNAVVHERLDAARKEAEAADRSGPFAGVPILIKDLVGEAETPVTYGSVFFRDFIADVTSEFRHRIHGAGFIDLGRTNTPEFGLLPTTEPVLHGPTRNPWDLERSAGGSSGGAAAAVASGMLPLAQGSDGGGSIRIPASACGLFGLKPSRGRLPRHPPVPSDELAVDGALTRTVRDSAAFLDAIGGPTPGEEYWAPPARGSFVDSVDRDPGRLRVAYSVRDYRGDRVHPECESAILRTAALVEGLGHDVEEDRPSIDGEMMTDAFLVDWSALAEHSFSLVLDGAEALDSRLGRLRRLAGDQRTMRLLSRFTTRDAEAAAFEPFTFALAQRSARRTPAEILTARSDLQVIAHQTGRFLERYDVFLTPVLGSPPVRIGAIDQSLPWPELIAMLSAYVAFTPLANFAGLPAMSVPLHWTEDGLPVGSHFMGRFGEEETLFGLAGRLEAAQPWSARRPGVHATAEHGV
jgi:amidase